MVDLVNISLKKYKNSSKSKLRASRCVRMADIAFLEPPKLISRTFLEWSSNFQIMKYEQYLEKDQNWELGINRKNFPKVPTWIDTVIQI